MHTGVLSLTSLMQPTSHIGVDDDGARLRTRLSAVGLATHRAPGVCQRYSGRTADSWFVLLNFSDVWLVAWSLVVKGDHRRQKHVTGDGGGVRATAKSRHQRSLPNPYPNPNSEG